jgi:DNA invertase Pin-like site-specific DNA recombinase
MTGSELIRPDHRSRLALVYVRQSSPGQVLLNQESLRLQYDLAQRARACGWPPERVRVLDADLGLTARTAQGRPGFQELVTLVTLGQVGILFAYDVTRLARNCTDWYQLLDLCGYRRCLVADQDGVHDPATPNGRLLLGLKGLIAELELHTLRARLTAGLLQKAQRGELAVPLPAGLVRLPSGPVVKHPDQEVQGRLELVFATFLRLKAASQVVRFLQSQQLQLPRRDRFGDLVWRPPTTAAALAILKNPAYAGAFVFGRTRTAPATGPGTRPVLKRLPLPEWKVCLRDRYPAYVDWATFENIQAMLHDNRNAYDGNAARGLPRRGQALLHGLVCCGECGHKLFVKYKNGVYYICNALRQQCQAPVCQKLPAGALDAHVVGAFLEALTAAELDVYERTLAELGREHDAVTQAQRQHLERLRYQARLAERQYNQTDPDNRLVAAELERRWEAALRELQQAEETWGGRPPPAPALAALPPELRQALEQAGRCLPQLWHQELLSPEQKKAFLRCLLDKVIAHRTAPDVIRVRIVWKGGDTTTAELPVPVNALARLSGADRLEQQVLELARQGQRDEDIAALLSRQGYRSPRRQVVLPSTVRQIRLRHRVFAQPSQSHPRSIPGYLTVPQVACQLQTTADWVYHRIHTGRIEVPLDPTHHLYVFPDRPKTLTLLRQLQAGKLQKLRF